MPQQLTYPGVYVEEIPSGVHTIIGVSTSITAFIGRALRGPVDEAVRIQSFGDYERVFGGLWIKSPMSYAVRQYFMNGGSDAIIVRAYSPSTPAANLTEIVIEAGADDITLQAASEGAWANNLHVAVSHSPEDATGFNLTIKEVVGGVTVAQEVYYSLSLDSSSSHFITKVLENQSALVRVKAGALPTTRPADIADVIPADPAGLADDGIDLVDVDLAGDEASKTGLYALDTADLVNIICVPPPGSVGNTTDLGKTFWDEVVAYARKRRAITIVNPPSTWTTVAAAVSGIDAAFTKDENAVLYFPNVLAPDVLRGNIIEEFAPCGIAAGVMARTDATRGVWKAPAGIDATLSGVQALEIKMTDGENGQLNPLGINCLRSLPAAGLVVWGARTLKGADRLASEWKYLPVRRLALYLEESLYRGTQWAVFEPNDEPLWAQLRTNVGAFMHQLYRQGAFQGRSPREAYFVKCDKETTTQNDINQGIVNVLIGFAPLKPAEFVVPKIQQIAGQIES
jgi:phage tail sheath protein FI